MNLIVLGLSLDMMGAGLLAVRDFDTTENLISKKLIPRFVRGWNSRAKTGADKITEVGELWPKDTGYYEVLEMCREHPYQGNNIPPDKEIQHLEVIEDPREHHATRWIHAVLNSGHKLRIHNVDLTPRRRTLRKKKARRLMDITRVGPAILLFSGFALQLFAYL